MQLMHPVDEIMIHGMRQGVQLAGVTAVLSGLDVGIPKRIGDLRG